MAVALPYFPSRSQYYQKIWARVKSGPHNQIRFKTFDQKEYQKEYYQRPEVKERNRRSTARLAVINLLGGECKKCGVRDLRCLQLDHKNGDGSKKARASFAVYNQLLKNPEKLNQIYQILCANCNWIKRYENKESYHLMPYGEVRGF